MRFTDSVLRLQDQEAGATGWGPGQNGQGVGCTPGQAGSREQSEGLVYGKREP